MVNPQRLGQSEGRPYLVQRHVEDRKARVAEEQVHDEERGSAENVIGWILLSVAALTCCLRPPTCVPADT